MFPPGTTNRAGESAMPPTSSAIMETPARAAGGLDSAETGPPLQAAPIPQRPSDQMEVLPQDQARKLNPTESDVGLVRGVPCDVNGGIGARHGRGHRRIRDGVLATVKVELPKAAIVVFGGTPLSTRWIFTCLPGMRRWSSLGTKEGFESTPALH